jgi:hydrogenase maturation protease
LDLLGHWDGADLAVVVDAMRSGLAPGTISRIELEDRESMSPAESGSGHGSGLGRSSTHGIGLVGVLRLARAVQQAPARTVVLGVEGEDFHQGSELSAAVAAAVDKAATSVMELVKEALGCA